MHLSLQVVLNAKIVAWAGRRGTVGGTSRTHRPSCSVRRTGGNAVASSIACLVARWQLLYPVAVALAAQVLRRWRSAGFRFGTKGCPVLREVHGGPLDTVAVRFAARRSCRTASTDAALLSCGRQHTAPSGVRPYRLPRAEAAEFSCAQVLARIVARQRGTACILSLRQLLSDTLGPVGAARPELYAPHPVLASSLPLLIHSIATTAPNPSASAVRRISSEHF